MRVLEWILNSNVGWVVIRVEYWREKTSKHHWNWWEIEMWFPFNTCIIKTYIQTPLKIFRESLTKQRIQLQHWIHQKTETILHDFLFFFFLFHCDLMRSRLSETVLILGRSSGSSSVQLRATWNADKTCFLAYTSCNSAGSMISDNGRSSRKTFLTRLSNPLPSFSGPASGSRAVRTSIRTMPKE